MTSAAAARPGDFRSRFERIRELFNNLVAAADTLPDEEFYMLISDLLTALRMYEVAEAQKQVPANDGGALANTRACSCAGGSGRDGYCWVGGVRTCVACGGVD